MNFWLGALLVLLLLAVAGVVYQAIGVARDRRLCPPRGTMVSIGTHRLHALASGSGTPTVVFEAALGASSISWALVQPRIAEITGTFAYDRAGMGFSDAGPEPRTAERIADEMRSLLEAAAVPTPYLLVGHSYGGLTCRLFAARYPHDVAGMVLLDPADPETWRNPTPEQRRKLWAGAALARRGALVAQLGIARLTAALARSGARRTARFAAVAVSGGILAGRAETIIAPVDRVPEEFRPALSAIWCQPRYYRSLASQIRHMRQSAEQVASTSLPSDLPLVVMSADSLPPAEMERNRRLAAQSSRGRHVVVADSRHWIQLDQPQTVIDAITELLDGIRSRPPHVPGKATG